jgi:hypothetical protein
MTQPKEPRRTSTTKALVIEGKGAPGGDLLSEALDAMAGLAEALLASKKRGGGHAFKLRQPEVRFEAPAGHGAATWSVRLRVPAFVTARDVELAAAAAGAERPLAHKAVLRTSGAPDPAEHPGRDRQPGTIRRTRGGAVSQHRARELR